MAQIKSIDNLQSYTKEDITVYEQKLVKMCFPKINFSTLWNVWDEMCNIEKLIYGAGQNNLDALPSIGDNCRQWVYRCVMRLQAEWHFCMCV